MSNYINLYDDRQSLGRFDLPSHVLSDSGSRIRLQYAVQGGGNGLVVRAQLAVGSTCAVKILRHQNDSRVDRFHNEARVLAELDHPHIARFYDRGTLTLGNVEVPWIAMELGGMNLYFVHDDGTIVTPELSGTILEGITRSSIIELAGKLGHQVEERRFSIDEWREGVTSGRITEVFACGTAAVVTPVGTLKWRDGEVTCGDNENAGPVTSKVRQTLVDIQYGRAEDTFGWMHKVC